MQRLLRHADEQDPAGSTELLHGPAVGGAGRRPAPHRHLRPQRGPDTVQEGWEEVRGYEAVSAVSTE